MTKLKAPCGTEFIVDDCVVGFVTQFTWWVNPRRHGGGYVYTQTNGKTRALHRILMAAREGEIVDHINHNTLDNRLKNLRFVSHRENCAHRRPGTRSKSGYRGVFFERNVYRAYCSYEGKNIYAGKFKTATEAARARDRKALELWGDKATLNFPGEKL
jgi:hypothetical protein